MLLSIPPVRGLIAVTGLALLAPAPVAAQQIQGELFEQGTGAPVAGAFVVLLDAGGRQVDAALTDAQGGFLLAAPAAGEYSLGLDRIGYLSTRTDPILLAAGQRLLYRLATVVEPVELDDLEVAIEPECEVRPAEGEAVSLVWQEARKALNATAYTQRMGLLEYAVTAHERELDPFTLMSRRESSRSGTGVSRGSPYVALPVATLAEQGFVQVQGDTLVYYGPDATTLLSDWFAETHCFALRESAEEPDRIGLAFEPAAERRLPDVQGTLWIDGATAELVRLDYQYTGLPRVAGREAATGRIEFERLPSGEWIIRRWWIRMPVVRMPEESMYSHITMDPDQRVTSVLAVEEESGEVTEVVSLRAQSARRPRRLGSEAITMPPVNPPLLAAPGMVCAADAAAIAGVVRDARTGASLPGAEVVATWAGVRATERVATRADASGRYALCGIPRGSRVAVQGSFPGRTGAAIVTVGATGRHALDLALRGDAALDAPVISSVVTIEKQPGEPGASRIVGRVRDDATGAPLPGAQVALPGLGSGAAAGPDGRFAMIGVPAGGHRLIVEHLGYVTGEAEVVVDPGQRIEIEARLVPSPIAVAALEVEIPGEAELEARSSGEARYVVRSRDIPRSAAITVGDVIQRLMPGVRVQPAFCPVILTRGGPVGLVVIDHQTFRDTCVLNLVEPMDIEALELLPSQTAQLRYGRPAGGGVILITTKRGGGE